MSFESRTTKNTLDGILRGKITKLAKLNFTYTYHSTKKAKARPGFDDWPEHPSVQINSSSPCINTIISELNICL